MEKYILYLSYGSYYHKNKPVVASSKDHHDLKWHCNVNLTLL